MARTPMRTFLRGCLRAINYLLAIVGVLMVAYALFMYVEFTEAHHSVPAPPDHDATASLLKQETLGSMRMLHAAQSEQTLGNPDAGWVHKASAESNATGLTEYPWFIYLLGGAGAFVFVTASIGILSADCAACGVTCFFGMYHALMVLLLLLQVSLVCFYFFDKSWEHELPPDATGEYAKLRDIVLHHIHACKIIGLSTLGLQLLALMVSCSLHYAENTPRHEYRPVPVRAHDCESASQISAQAPSEAMHQ